MMRPAMHALSDRPHAALVRTLVAMALLACLAAHAQDAPDRPRNAPAEQVRVDVPASAPADQVRFDVAASELQGLRDDDPLWSLPLPVAGGPTSNRLLTDTRVY